MKLLGSCSLLVLPRTGGVRAAECIEPFIASSRPLNAYLGTEAIKDSHLEGQITQLRVVLLTALPCKAEQDRAGLHTSATV